MFGILSCACRAERICIPEDGSSLWLQRLIGPGADATNMNEAIQRGQWLSTAWKNKLSPDAEFKTNDFINFIGIKWGNMPIHTNKTCRKRKKPDSGNEIQDSLQISLHPSPARAETVVGISHDRPVRDSDNSLTFKTLWTELTAVESPPKYWELFTAVGIMETMYQRWRHNHMAVKMVQHNISPSEATVIRDLMQTLSPRLSFLILGIKVTKIALLLKMPWATIQLLSCFSSRWMSLREASSNGPTWTFTPTFGHSLSAASRLHSRSWSWNGKRKVIVVLNSTPRSKGWNFSCRRQVIWNTSTLLQSPR